MSLSITFTNTLPATIVDVLVALITEIGPEADDMDLRISFASSTLLKDFVY